MRHRIKFLAVLLVLGMLAAACGQKPGVHQGRQVGFQPGTGEPTDDDFVDEFDDDFDFDDEALEPTDDVDFDDPDGAPVGSGSGTPTRTGDGTAGAPATQEQQRQPTGEQQQQEQQQPEQQQQSQDPNDTRGVTDAEIRIGVHAPLTGAAPLPQAEFRSGATMYWDHVGQVANRDVRVIVRDDQYNPSRATSVCNDLIQREEVFILVGGGGADQIAACARVAAQQRVPYLSAGVDEGVLRQLPNYFALSMSYVQQAPLLAQWIEKNAPAEKIALVRDRTPGFNNVVQRLDQELQRRGMETQVIQYQNGPSTAQAVSGFETAFSIMAPSDFVQIVGSPGGSNPKWVGVGITMGLNTVANAACRSSNNNYDGMFFSPFPGLNVINQLDPEFEKAEGVGDIELALWGLNKSIHEVLKRLDGNITRSGFVQVLQRSHQNPLKTNVFPELRHTPDDHFGAQSVHVLQVNCSTQKYETPQGGTFQSSF